MATYVNVTTLVSTSTYVNYEHYHDFIFSCHEFIEVMLPVWNLCDNVNVKLTDEGKPAPAVPVLS